LRKKKGSKEVVKVYCNSKKERKKENIWRVLCDLKNADDVSVERGLRDGAPDRRRARLGLG
jgi:hypothetical protein